MAEDAGENADAAAPCPSRASARTTGVGVRIARSDAAANATRPPTITGFAPILSLSAPKIGLRITSATS